MEPRFSTSTLLLVLSLITISIASPIGEPKQRQKRAPCDLNSDPCVEDAYWNEALALGFFVNKNDDAAGGGAAQTTGTKRGMDHGPLNYGSGSGHMIQRSDIPGQKAQNAQASEQTVKASPAVVKTDVSPPAAAPAAVAAPPSAPAVDSNKHTTTFCQGEKEWLQCPMYRVIKINKAFWGRMDQTTCTSPTVKRTLSSEKQCEQDEANTMKKVQTMCDDENACELVASDTFFDRADCPDVYKYVKLDYECLHSETRIKDVPAS